MKFLKNKDYLTKFDSFIFLPKCMEILPLELNLKIKIDDLLEIEDQKNQIIKNTQLFAEGKPSNNILLWGAKGMGKSTLIKCVVKFINCALKNNVKLIEIFNNNLEFLPDIVYQLNKTGNKFIIFIDDVTFYKTDKNFSLFKSLLEGSILSNTNNIKYYITSNLRHLSSKNDTAISNDDPLTSKEAKNNLISLSDRFGCWIGFHRITKSQYLKIVDHYIKKHSLNNLSKNIHNLAIEWSITKGEFSGRTAIQFLNNLILNQDKY